MRAAAVRLDANGIAVVQTGIFVMAAAAHVRSIVAAVHDRCPWPEALALMLIEIEALPSMT